METMEKQTRRRGRPPKEGGGFSETRELLLQAGVEVLTEKGFSSAGIDEILRRVGVPKGSFYHFFGSKEAFGTELLTRYAAYFARKLDRFLLDTTMQPLQRLQAFIDGARNGMARYEYKRGCLVGNMGQEMGALPESFRGELREVFQDWQDRVAHCLGEAKELGEIPENSDCHQLAAVFWIGWEGAVLRTKLEGAPDALDLFTDFFFAALRR
ncbi:acrylate utilization transcriptional regulator AcuR [Geomonas propionica]|uniref:TetR/AcrR family transcriptional regulator n=1 Tax=Geomonas propionica TaxID=2798582 RepID=A0ABS0YPT3_9BACT|nr:TetR/AcrR family transcriptional regulator [Geomonas propionica]MBJ6799926.1 TetR/AcrR family transcriptional regulator [Geomonas propionica]